MDKPNIDSLIESKQKELADLVGMKANGIELTEFTPENNSAPTPDEERLKEVKARMLMYAASIDREISRITAENAVRIGDSTLAESSAVETIKEALKKLHSNYLKYA